MTENEQYVGTIDTREQAEAALESVIRVNERLQNNIFNSVHLGIIEECEKDANGNYNGKATVRLVSTPGVRTRCLMPVPSGQSFWFGGFPPAGSLCQVAWLPLGVAIITAFYPLNYRTLVNVERFIDVIPGEILMQGCSGVLKEEQTPTARGLFDRHGRIHFETKDGTARIVLGDPGLLNGLADLDSTDLQTGEKTLLRIQSGSALINITEESNISIDTSDAHVVIKDGVLSISADRVNVVAPDIRVEATDNLQIEVDGGKRLATEDFVVDVYNRHSHPPGSFTTAGGNVVGFSGNPIPEGDSGDMTTKVKVL